MSQIARVKKITAFINKKTGGFTPEIAIITGSGLAASVPPLKGEIKIPYASIPGFLKSTVAGHSGNLLFGTYKNKKIMVMQGRFHYYEGHDIKDLALAVRVMKFLGVQKLLVSAAVGSINAALPPGALAVLKDHINLMGANPLAGNYDPAFGPMFTDMSEPYSPRLQRVLSGAAKKLKIKSAPAVYIAVSGPSFETPAEIRAFKTLGADVVGMSVVPEVIAARQLDIEVCGAAWVSNLASGISKTPLSHAETLRETKKIEGKFKALLEAALPLM